MTDLAAKEQVIDDWRDAYEKFNGKPAPKMTHHLGWFYIHYEHAYPVNAHKR